MGSVTTAPYKQIIIVVCSGADDPKGAFDYLIHPPEPSAAGEVMGLALGD